MIVESNSYTLNIFAVIKVTGSELLCTKSNTNRYFNGLSSINFESKYNGINPIRSKINSLCKEVLLTSILISGFS